EPTADRKLFWGAHARFVPQQALFLKAVPMFLAKAVDVCQSHLSEIGLRIADPDKPTGAWITFCLTRCRSHDADHRQVQPGRIFEVHLLPKAPLDGTARLVLPAPLSCWIRVCCLLGWLQLFAPFARRTAFACWGWGRAVKTAIAFESDQRSCDWQATE